MTIAIGTFIEVNEFWRFQNFYVGETRRWDGKNWVFSGFGYSGSTTDLQGGNVDAQLVWPVNDLTLGLCREAVDERWIVEVKTVWLNPDSLVEKTEFMNDVFMAVGFDHDTERISLRLSSPMDAISVDVPRRRLTETLVGAMPSTGEILLL